MVATRKMTKKPFTSIVIEKLLCDPGKNQSIFHDAKTPGLGLRVTSTGAKSYIFESKLHGKNIRITIGSPQAWPLKKAQTEAARLKVMIDQGIDPRQIERKKRALADAEKQKERLEKITLGDAWIEYIEERRPLWSERHYQDHIKVMHQGGEVRRRSNELTVPGVLASLSTTRLIDLTNKRIEAWARIESTKRPTQARLALRLLKAFLFWCGSHSTYKEIVTDNAAQSKNARESLGKPKTKSDVLQREQLAAWFQAVRQIQNPVISAYLQTLLLTGRRREEILMLKWEHVDFQWNSLTVKDKIEDSQVIPLTPYLADLLSHLPRRNQWLFSSPAAASGRLVEPTKQHNKVCSIANVGLSIHGLRRSFASLAEWVETPAGIAAQIQGHKPQGVREKHYIRRPLDLLRMWHVKIEAWILQEAGINFTPSKSRLRSIT